eukprot:PhM_4_TR10153/c1_g1_i1/m.7831
MEDGGLYGLSELRAVWRRAALVGVRREANLVVDDDVHRAADFVVIEVAQPHGLVAHALPGEGSITVDEDSHDFAPSLVLLVVLLGAGLAADDGVDSLEVGRVRQQLNVDGLLRAGVAVEGDAEVVLDITALVLLISLGGLLALELEEDLRNVLAANVCKDVEAAAMCHADDEALDPSVGGFVDDLVDQGDQRLGTVKTEALRGGILGMEELLEALGDGEVLQRVVALLWRESLVLVDAAADPARLLTVDNVHVFPTDLVAVDLLQLRDDLAQGEDAGVAVEAAELGQDAEGESAVHVCLGESEVGELKLLGDAEVKICGEHAQWIKVGDKMSSHFVGTNHPRQL